jgi:peptidoglycan/xylan/chitin deacetylase (PgdA/CDA1 family)
MKRSANIRKRRKSGKRTKFLASVKPIVIFSAREHFERIQKSLSNFSLSDKPYDNRIKIARPIGHSFLFWLILPFVILWLTAGYLVGFVKDNPGWSKAESDSNVKAQTVPYVQKYPFVNIGNSEGFATFWFDDAWLSDYMNAYPILRQHNFTAAIAVPVNFVEQKNYVNWAQLRKLQASGWEITNHSLNHDCTMNTWNKKAVENELDKSSEILWKNRLSSDIFVTPCGVDSEIMREVAAEKFLAYRTVDPGFNDINYLNISDIKVKNIDSDISVSEIESWIDYARDNRYWVILVFHKVGEENGDRDAEKYDIGNSDFSEIVNYVMSSNLTVVVPSQIL